MHPAAVIKEINMNTENTAPSFAVVTDGFSNLPGRVLKELDINITPCTYHVDGEPVDYSGDIEAFDAQTYYYQMRRGCKITTALINSQAFMDVFEPFLKNGQDVLYVGLSSGVSGTYHSAVMAAQELMERYPGRKVRTVDSLGAGLGTGLLACRGADLRNEGKTLDETADALNEETLRLCEFFTVGDLKYLHRTGRISAATAKLGTVLDIKPLLYGDYEGHIVSCAKHRGRKRVVDAIVQKFEKLAVDVENGRVAISHGDCLEEAEALAQRVCAIAKPKELIICPHEPFTGSHVGPGMLALFFFGSKRLD